MSRADDLREAFDRGFAAAPATARPPQHELLRIELAGEPHVIPLAAIDSIHVDLPIVPVPATSTTLLGVIAVRGAIVPVYDLRGLLGLATARPPRWLAIAGTSAYAFDGFEGHLAVTDDPRTRGVVSHEGRLHRLIDLEILAPG